jgi:hypothetical protein
MYQASWLGSSELPPKSLGPPFLEHSSAKLGSG